MNQVHVLCSINITTILCKLFEINLKAFPLSRKHQYCDLEVISSHHSIQSPYLQICLKFICNLIISMSSTFVVVCGHVQSSKNSELPDIHAPVKEHSCFSSQTVNMWPFHGLFTAPVCTCCLWFHILKWPPSIVVKCCLLVPSTKLWCASQRKCMLNKLHSRRSSSATGHEFNVIRESGA